MRAVYTLGLIVMAGAPGVGAERVSFNRDIRPIMADTCFRCHGPDKSSRMAGLRLDIREEALKRTPTKVIPIVPGKPEESAIIERVFSKNPARVMPPKYAHKDLPEAQKDTIRRWVAEGAEYEGHWAYRPVNRPPVPGSPPGAIIRNPVDLFIQQRLQKEGVAPSPEADPRTLIRRATLDLTGLPPTAEETREFVRNPSNEAYEQLVDRLLGSPRYAEKQTMHWLDAVRYADTCGFHGDNPVPAWPYRDYVLRSFRDNKPFDQFTREQLAGDLIPGSAREQLAATAYNRLTRTSAEGGIQPKEYLAKYAADRVRTAGSVWLGATMGCAECHDHKFDPITSKDFYSMKAFFADIKETGLVPDRGEDAWGELLPLPDKEQQQRLDALKSSLEEARGSLAEQAKLLANGRPVWERETLSRFDAGELSWRFQRPVAATSAKGTVLTVYNERPVEASFDYQGSVVAERKPGEGLVVASGPNPDNDSYTVTLRPGAGKWAALGIEVHQDESLAGVRVARGGDRLVLTEVEAAVPLPGGPARKAAFVLATSSLIYPSIEHPAMAAIDGDPNTGWGLTTYGEGRTLFLALRFQKRLVTGAETLLTVRLRHDSQYRRATIGRFRLALSPAAHSWPGSGAANSGLPDRIVKALRIPDEQRSEQQREWIESLFHWMTPELEPQVVEVAKLEARCNLAEAAVPRVVVTRAVEPAETRVLPRGNWMDDSGEVVEPAIPAFLGKLPVEGRATRLDLANWIASENNPLTARVFANRTWRQFFGTGLSKVLDDLGSQGEWPAHPELLDWLAAEFMKPDWRAEGAHAWNVKHLIRLIVTSHTYRQSSLSRPDAEARDTDNRLLARQNRFRVDAEVVRDSALAASGLLAERFGGPSVRPYQPEGYLGTLNFPKRDYSASHGDDLYRRSVYTHWQRTFLHPSMVTFDAPTREECTVNRVNSNTPLQALVLLNEPGYVEAARVLGQRALAQGGGTPAARIRWVFQRVLQRDPSAEERRILTELHRKSLVRFQAAPAAARKLVRAGEAPAAPNLSVTEAAAMTTVARAVLNLHEMVTRN